MKEYSHIDFDHPDSRRFVSFQELMRFRVRDILLVSSLYDAFLLGEEGGLYEHLMNEYRGLNLSHTPGITRVASGRHALELMKREHRFDMILITLHLDDMHVLDFARKLRDMGVDTPLVLLTYDSRELNELVSKHDVSCFDRIFMWQGNFRILLAIIKCIEDLKNVERDTQLAGVQAIILIEDNVKFYSSYLPIVYTQLMRHSQKVIDEGFNITHKMLRMRARAKILLCHTYEEAWSLYRTYHESILGVISDIRFPRNNEPDALAGLEFARNVKERHPDVPVLLQSNEPELEQEAYAVGASFLLKNSPRLLRDLQKFMMERFCFDDFIFCMPDGCEVGRATDLRELGEMIHTVPDESLLFHAERNHFSNWLKARTEFFLAHKLRPRKVTDFASPTELREALISYLREYNQAQHQGRIIDFDPDNFDPDEGFSCIGGGSLGGKGRGLVFLSSLLTNFRMRKKFKNIEISVPPTMFLKTDIFDQFIDSNDLGEYAFEETSDEEIERRFLEGCFPCDVVHALREFLRVVKHPLAVRSSSLLEDSQYQPFAGVYETYMVPNNHQDLEIRLEELLSAIKRVYASTFSIGTKEYIKATPYRLEEEKMAVLIQKMTGSKRGNRFYPDFSGVARSHNFYPIKPMKAEDGIASVALGLGAMVVEGGKTTRFCPKFPRHLVQFSSVDDTIAFSQKDFYSLELPDPEADTDPRRKIELLREHLGVADKDGVLGPIASTYSPENNAVYDGVSRQGIRIVTFAPILKSDYFPLANILRNLLKLGRWGMSTPVELEFSVDMSAPPGKPKLFSMLQLRPMVLNYEQDQVQLDEVEPEQVLCQSNQVLGNGMIDTIRDIVVVDAERFDRSKTVQVADEIGLFNLELREQDAPYLLIGLGRWGSADHWLGIPVTWDKITGARVIVETDFKDMKVTPSQGTHFFQNLNAFKIGYFTVSSHDDRCTIDWDWLAAQEAVKSREYSRHIRLNQPLVVKMDGQESAGVILKPEVS